MQIIENFSGQSININQKKTPSFGGMPVGTKRAALLEKLMMYENKSVDTFFNSLLMPKSGSFTPIRSILKFTRNLFKFMYYESKSRSLKKKLFGTISVNSREKSLI